MSFLKTIENIFHKAESAEQVVLSDVSHFVDKAEPIVEDIEETLKTLPQTPLLADIEKFLAKYEPDLAKVGAVAAPLAGLSGSALWAAIASTALSFLTPSGTAASLLNLAVELAYSIFKQKAAESQPKAA